jgi:NADH:ubiquinone reductase (H+-translocating)
VVAGAGFAGMKAAADLAVDHDVVVVAPQPRFTFLPLVHELLSEESVPAEISRPLAELARVTYVQGHAVSVEEKRLVTDKGDRIRFDSLVVALGAKPHYFGVPGAPENAHAIWSLEQALEANVRLKRLLLHPPAAGAYRVTVVGAGATGLEVATEAAAFFDRYDAPHEVTVLEMRDQLFPLAKPGFRREVEKGLKRFHVKVLFETKVETIGPHAVTVSTKGEAARELPSDLTLWCAGIRGRSLEPLSMKVDWHLQSLERPDVFIAGDCARFPEPVAQLAQTAEAQGAVVAHNVRHPSRLRTYTPRLKGTILSLGPGYAVAETGGGKVLAGALPWHIKKQYYKWTLRSR